VLRAERTTASSKSSRWPRYYRIESQLTDDVEMDDARRRTLDRLAEAAEALIEQRRDDLEAIAQRLAGAGPV